MLLTLPWHVRPLASRDLDAVAQLESELFAGEAWSRQLLEAEYLATQGERADRTYVVAEGMVAGKPNILGYGGLWWADGRGKADLLTLATRADMRARGIGTHLLSYLLRSARTMGCQAVLLEVRVSNAAARSLYSRHGFAPIGVRRRYYTAPVEDALVMQLPLRTAQHLGAVGAEVTGS